MTKENNKMQVDIDTLKKQNVNDLLSIKELYSKLEELGEKIRQVKYIDNTLVKKIKKEYEKLNKIILDENVQIKLTNGIETINSQIETINSQLNYVASDYIIENERFNIYSDGTNSQQTTAGINQAIQYAINKGFKKITLTAGTYLIKPVKDGWVYPNPTTNYLFGVNFDNIKDIEFRMYGVTFKCDVTDCYNGQVMSCNNSKNIKIVGLKIDGNRENHIYTAHNTSGIAKTHENFFNCIILGSQNIQFKDCEIINAIGDGFMISKKSLDGIYIKNCIIEHSRRNNISFTDGTNVVIENCYIGYAGSDMTNSQGTQPRLGIGIEGYKDGGENDEYPTKCLIKNCTFYENMYGDITNYNGSDVEITSNEFDIGCSLGYGIRTNIHENNFLNKSGKGAIAINQIGYGELTDTRDNKVCNNFIENYDVAFSIRCDDTEYNNNTIQRCNECFSIYNLIGAKNIILKNNNVNVEKYFIQFKSDCNNTTIKSINNTVKVGDNGRAIQVNSNCGDNIKIEILSCILHSSVLVFAPNSFINLSYSTLNGESKIYDCGYLELKNNTFNDLTNLTGGAGINFYKLTCKGNIFNFTSSAHTLLSFQLNIKKNDVEVVFENNNVKYNATTNRGLSFNITDGYTVKPFIMNNTIDNISNISNIIFSNKDFGGVIANNIFKGDISTNITSAKISNNVKI